ALPLFLELAAEQGLPMREQPPVRYFSKFYGQWGGKTHLEQISVESLARMLETEFNEGFNELSCHPGYVDPDYPTGYSREREAALAAFSGRDRGNVFRCQTGGGKNPELCADNFRPQTSDLRLQAPGLRSEVEPEVLLGAHTSCVQGVGHPSTLEACAPRGLIPEV